MKLNPSILIDTRYKSDSMLLYIKITWTESFRKYGSTRFSTGLYVNREDWDEKRGNVKATNEETIKLRDRLNKILDYARAIDMGTSSESIKAIKNYIEYSQNEAKPIMLDRLSDFIQQFISMNKKKFSRNGIRKYDTVLRNVMMYCKVKGVSDILGKMTPDQQTIFFNGYLEFLAEHEGPNEWGKDKKKYNNSSIRGEFALLSSVCSTFKNTGLAVDLDFASMLGEGDTERTYCTPEELKAIWVHRNAQRDDLPLTQLKAIDNFLFQAFTGCRHQDLYELSPIRMDMRHGNTFWTYYSNKVKKKEVTVPLNNICLEILYLWSVRRFKQPLSNGVLYDLLIPVMSSNKVNQHLHEFLKTIPAFQGVQKVVRYRLSERIETEVPRWQLITSHVARHSYSHYLSSNGMTIDETAHLLNHTSSETTKKHYGHFGIRHLHGST